MRGTLTNLGKIKLQGDINSISFHPSKNVILVGTYSKLYMIGIWQHQTGSETVYRFEGISLLDECGIDSVCCFYSTVFSYARDIRPEDNNDTRTDTGEDRLCLTIWKVETIQNNLLIDTNKADSKENTENIETYSTLGCDIDTLLELEPDNEKDAHHDGNKAKMEEVSLTERELSLSIEKDKEKNQKKANNLAEEHEEANPFFSRVCRFEFQEECLYAAMNNLVPIKRRYFH